MLITAGRYPATRFRPPRELAASRQATGTPVVPGNFDAADAPQRMNERFVAEPQAVRAARHAVEWLDGSLSPALCRKLSLLVSELVTNAVLHGSERPSDPIALRIWISPERLRVEVTDRGHNFNRPRSPKPGELRTAGWGLYLVEQVADRFGVSDEHRTSVWFEFDLSPTARRSDLATGVSSLDFPSETA